jgi:hypothetical protein
VAQFTVPFVDILTNGKLAFCDRVAQTFEIGVHMSIGSTIYTAGCKIILFQPF